MNGKLKRDAKRIIKHFNDLKQASWIGNRFWWPDFLFHFTDIKNAVSILNSGFMLSRNQLELLDRIWEDSASDEIIDRIDAQYTDYVRFYFRPLTPTAYRNEGFRPVHRLYHNAHCPVPVYFLFDLRQIITLEAARFSKGSLAGGNYTFYESAEDIRHLSFTEIYHNAPFRGDDRSHIVNMRPSEVVFPKRVSLYYLKYICCRSQAEYITLQNLLSPTNWDKWKSKVRFRNPHVLFYRRWLHVRDVTLTKELITFDLHSPADLLDYGPYHFMVEIYDSWTHDKYYFECDYVSIVDELPNLRLELNLTETDLSDYSVRLMIDNKLAFSGTYTDDTIPF